MKKIAIGLIIIILIISGFLILKPHQTTAQKKKIKQKVKISADEWTQVNGPYGGWITDMEKSGSTILAGTSFNYELGGNGVYRITNNGSTWQALGGTNKPVKDISVDPSNPENIFLVANDSLSVTQDGGNNWQKIDLSAELYNRVAASSANSSLVFAATTLGGKGQFFISENDGSTWQQATSLPETEWSVKPIWAGIPEQAKGWVTAIAPHPTNENILFVGTNSALFKSTDKGQNWSRIDSTFHRSDVLGIKINPSNSNEVFVRVGVYEEETCMAAASKKDPKEKNRIEKTSCAGIYKSTDLGATWQQLDSYYFDPSEGGVFIDENNSNNVYAIFSRLVQRSTNSGQTWKKFFWTHDDNNVVDVGLERLIAGSNSSEIFIAGRQGLLHSSDSGKHWHNKNKGFIGSEVVDIVKTKNGTVYAGTYSLGMFKSADNGQNWSFSSYELENPYVMALAKHPTNPKSVFLTTNGGVYASNNGARSWKTIGAKYFFGKSGILPGIAHFHGIAFDPKNAKRIYVGGGGDQYTPSGSGISISEDSGKTWKASNKGFKKDVHVSKIIVDQKNPTIVYATTQGSTEFSDKTGDGQGVYKSKNRGKTWKKINRGLGTVEINTISIDPKNSKILYLGTDDDGVYKSVNGGNLWKRLTVQGLPDSYGVGDIAIDPKNHNIVYIATVDYFRLFNSRGLVGDHGVYRSTNGGKTWEAFNDGLNHKGAFSLELDSKRNVLYVGTRGGGIYWRKLH